MFKNRKKENLGKWMENEVIYKREEIFFVLSNWRLMLSMMLLGAMKFYMMNLQPEECERVIWVWWCKLS